MTEITASPSSEIQITKVDLPGGPITAVTFVPPNYCYYGQGPYLHRIASFQQQRPESAEPPPLHIHDDDDDCGSNNNDDDDDNVSRLLVFDQGGSIHGIRQSYHNNRAGSRRSNVTWTPTSHSDNDDDDVLVVFGGRNICWIDTSAVADSVDDNDDGTHNDHSCKTRRRSHQPRMQVMNVASSTCGNSQTKGYMEVVDDWIWECQFWNCDTTTTSDDALQQQQHYKLLVGLAHNRVAIYSVTIMIAKYSTTTTTTTTKYNDAKLRHHRVVHMQCESVHQGSTRCLSYCMDISLQSSVDNTSIQTATIAVGTISNTILVWSMPTASSATTPESTCVNNNRSNVVSTFQYPILEYSEHILKGHHGAIYSVQFHPSGCGYLLSTSDDRSVRLWSNQQQQEQGGDNNNYNNNTDDCCSASWVLLWTAWGHTARGWDVAWAWTPWRRSASVTYTSTIHSYDQFEDYVVVSTGEDGTMRIWDVITGNPLSVSRGHACQCIWRVDVMTFRQDVSCGTSTSNADVNNISKAVSTWAVTGSNDGSFAFYNLNDRIPLSDLNNNVIDATAREGPWQFTATVPDDRPEINHEWIESNPDQVEKSANELKDTISSTARPQKKKMKKAPQQIVAGMKVLHNVNPILVVATRFGSVFVLDLCSGTWEEMLPWMTSSPLPVKAEADGAGGCCLDVHPTALMVAVGTIHGDVYLSNLKTKSLWEETRNSDRHVVLCARQHRSVQKLEWIKPDLLASFHVQSVLLWSFPNLTIDTDASSNRITGDGSTCQALQGHVSLTLSTGVKGLAICSAYDEDSARFVIGDTRGNLALFILPPNDSHSSPSVSSTSVLRGAHRKEHVTDVRWLDSKYTLSVGNDGHVVKCLVDSCIILKLLSVPVGSFTGLSNIWKFPGSSMNIAAGGYYGNTFAVADIANGYEFFSVDTGGRQRPIDVSIAQSQDSQFPISIIVSVCNSRSDGRNDILVSGYGISQRLRDQSPRVRRHCNGTPLHGESIFDACLFQLDDAATSIALLTASEDCSSKIAWFRNGTIVNVSMLPPQISGIRAVCHCRLDSGSTIVVLGGKTSVQLFMVYDVDNATTNEGLQVRFLCNGNPPTKSRIDQRINCVAAKTLPSETGEAEVMVISGDSNGACVIYRFTESSGFDTSKGQLFYQDDRPVLAIDLVKLGNRYLLVLGDTSGIVRVFDVPCALESNAWEDLNSTELICYTAHSMGTNAITSIMTTSTDGSCILRVCSGGDDQAICCCDLRVSIKEPALQVSVCRKRMIKEAALSALKGIAFITEHTIVATGYDQRLSIWRCDDDRLVGLADSAVDVGDINCLANCSVADGSHLVAVGGAGVELLSIRL